MLTVLKGVIFGFFVNSATVSASGFAATDDLSPIASSVDAPIAPPTGLEARLSGLWERGIGTYTWARDYWKNPDSVYMQFLQSSEGRDFHGDVYVNVGDWDSTRIDRPVQLMNFVLQYRMRTGRQDTIVYITYGDVTKLKVESMWKFTNSFFDWYQAIDEPTRQVMGLVGISYDVEHMEPTTTRDILIHAQQRKASIPGGPALLRVQHTIDGDYNVKGTDFIMKHADSALAMVYSNFIVSDEYDERKSIVGFGRWLLQKQCPKCTRASHVRNHYQAKISLMVETTCTMKAKCGRKSLCAFDSPVDGGFHHTKDLLSALMAHFGETLPLELFDKLFDLERPFVLHDWDWTRCMPGFPNPEGVLYPNCENYHKEAKQCRKRKE
jgi:hypothetical protein